MNPLEQRIEIAKMDGWKIRAGICLGGWIINDGKRDVGSFWFDREKTPTLKDCIEAIPDYLNDLNAIHGIMLSCRDKKIPGTTNVFKFEYPKILRTIRTLWKTEFDYLNVSAGEQAEALLRTIGKWKD